MAMLPRSEGGLLMSPSTSNDAIYSTSPLSEYSATVPDPIQPGSEDRQSTGASEALQYYWSSSAGERNGSISSNLGRSPIESSSSSNILTSPYTLSPHPLAPSHASMSPMMMHTKSDVSLQELVDQEEEQARMKAAALFPDAPELQPRHDDLPDPRTAGLVHRDPGTGSGAGSSNRRIHLVSYPSDGSIPRVSDQPASPSPSDSGESEYSLPDESGELPAQQPRRQFESPTLSQQPQLRSPGRLSPMSQRPRGLVDTEGRLDVLLDPSFEEWAHQRAWDPPNGVAEKPSSEPISPAPVAAKSPSALDDDWRSPSATLLDRRRRVGSPVMRTPSPGRDRTPRNSNLSGRSGTHTPRASLAKSGRLLFVAPADVSRNSIDALEREVNGLSYDKKSGSRVGLSILGKDFDDPDMPRSAPALKTDFGDIGIPETRRPTSLLPSVNEPSPGHPSTTKLAPPEGEPVMNARRSPEPPPRSELRKQRTRTPTPPGPVVTASPTLKSPMDNNNDNNTPNPIQRPGVGLRTHTLPTIINTPHTPVTSPQAPSRGNRIPSPRSSTAPLPDNRSGSPALPGMTESGTIQDLTKILGGAIDEIGLIDSRDTPPPNIGEPEKSRTPLRLSQVPVRSVSNNATAAPIQTPEQHYQQLSPTGSAFQQGSSPNSNGRGGMLGTSPIGLGIMSVGASVAAAGGAATQRTGNVVRHVRKASSILSLRSTSNYSHMSPTTSTFSSGGLPQAIMYGNIKQLKTAGDRARAYAQSMAELMRAESGLRDWLYTNHYPAKPVPTRPATKTAGMAQLGLRAPEEQSTRNVSGASEFPMRVDAYTARELSVRNLEPQDAPTALPSNLPYPQLQNIKGSGSVQSLASLSSYTSKQPRGLGRAFGFLKRDKENTSLAALGPMNPQAYGSMAPPMVPGSKRDLRNMAISSPTMPGRSSLDSVDGPRVQPSLAVPRGPRDVPGRASHEHTPSRSSLDSAMRPHRGSPGPGQPHGASPLAQRDDNAPSDEEVRNLAEMLPHGERAVIRAYLQTYGEPSYALTAYIEDEKNGTLMRA